MIIKNKAVKVIYLINIIAIVLSFVIYFICEHITGTREFHSLSMHSQIRLIIKSVEYYMSFIIYVFPLIFFIFNLILLFKYNIIQSSLLKKIYFINFAIIILILLTLIILFSINHYPYIDFDGMYFAIAISLPVIGITFGLTFLIINLIVFIKHRNIITFFLVLINLLWVIYSFFASLFGYFPILRIILDVNF